MIGASSDASVPDPPEDTGCTETTPAKVWRRLAYGYAAVVAIGIGYFLFRMPFQLDDNLPLILSRADQS